MIPKTVTAQIEKVQEHPATNTNFFRWWLLLPLVGFFLWSWGRPVLEEISEEPMMAEAPREAIAPQDYSLDHEAGTDGSGSFSIPVPEAPERDVASSPPSWVGHVSYLSKALGELGDGIQKFASAILIVAWGILRIRKGEKPVEK